MYFHDATPEQLAAMQQFADILGDAQWSEARPWFAMFKADVANQNPPAFARYIGAAAIMELALWFPPDAPHYLEWVIGRRHSQEHATWHLHFPLDHIAAVLAPFVAAQAQVTLDTMDALVLAPLAAQGVTLLREADDGEFVLVDPATLPPAQASDVPVSSVTPEDDPLAGIDAIAWGELRHAYGPASDVPALLRALAAPDASTRENARWNAYGTIIHQGTVYSATAAAVPFLRALVRHPATPDRAELIGLLATIAASSDSPSDLHQQIQAAITDGWQEYTSLLESSESSVRFHAALLLAHCTSRKQESADTLLKRLAREEQDDVRANIVLALTTLHDNRSETLTALNLSALHNDDTLTRLCSRIALLTLQQSETNDAVAAASIAQFADLSDALQSRYDEHTQEWAVPAFPWTRGSLKAMFGDALAYLGEQAPITQIIEAMLLSVDDDDATILAAALLRTVFPQPTTLDALSSVQRVILTAIAETDEAWSYYGETDARVAAALGRGPDANIEQDELRELLGLGSADGGA